MLADHLHSTANIFSLIHRLRLGILVAFPFGIPFLVDDKHPLSQYRDMGTFHKWQFPTEEHQKPKHLKIK
jgi:hypothetical protein